MTGHYADMDLIQTLTELGLRAGDAVFLDARSVNAADFEVLRAGLMTVIGNEGALVAPTYTFSFIRRQIFDADRSPSLCGGFSEWFRTLPGVVRSADPLVSVAGQGSLSRKLIEETPIECFGPEGFWTRFHRAGGKFCSINEVFNSGFVHWAERRLNVDYRYDLLFTGVIHRNGRERKSGIVYFGRDRNDPGAVTDLSGLERRARQSGKLGIGRWGDHELTRVGARDLFALIEEGLEKDSSLLIAGDRSAKAKKAAGSEATVFDRIRLPEKASMSEMIHALWRLPRDIVSDGYDAALTALAGQAPMRIHEYPTGARCWTWIVPEKWTCDEAYLEDEEGHRLFSYSDNPLHVVSYSLPFDGVVSRNELMDHLHVHRVIPEAVPFVYKYYERDWGLCCGRRMKESLTDDRYRVRIDSRFSRGDLKVGETIIPGRGRKCFTLCAHLCHPAMVNDDLAGVVAGVEIMRRLMAKGTLRYTYRLLLVPETIGSAAYLSHNEDLIDDMIGGLFLEMLGVDQPPALQLSFQGDTQIDKCARLAVRAHDPDAHVGPFLSVIQNDERTFNAPGVRVPMLSLSRATPKTMRDDPGRAHNLAYREYHSSFDTPKANSMARLEDACDIVMKIIETIERNVIPVNQYKGEPFLSRYGLYVDSFTNSDAYGQLSRVLQMIDGAKSVADIAEACGVSFSGVEKIVRELKRRGLVARRHPFQE